MSIVVKKSAERFRQIVDFAGALPEGQSVSSCVVRAYDSFTGSDVTGGMVERPEVVGGRAVRFVGKGGAAGSEYIFRVEATVGDEVLVEDVTLTVDRDPWESRESELSKVASIVDDGAGHLARAGEPDLSSLSKAKGVEPNADAALPVGGTDGLLPINDAPEIVSKVKDGEEGEACETSEPVAKKSRARTGAFAHERNSTTTTELQVRAYGSGSDDKRVFRASSAGLPVASCPDGACAPDGGKPVDVDLAEVALGKRVLRRGKMSAMANAMRDGLKPDSPFVFAELDAAERERVGKKYGVVDGNHRVAHLMLSGVKTKVPAIGARKPVAKSLSTVTPTKGTEWTSADIAGRRAKVCATAKEKRRAINA